MVTDPDVDMDIMTGCEEVDEAEKVELESVTDDVVDDKESVGSGTGGRETDVENEKDVIIVGTDSDNEIEGGGGNDGVEKESGRDMVGNDCDGDSTDEGEKVGGESSVVKGSESESEGSGGAGEIDGRSDGIDKVKDGDAEGIEKIVSDAEALKTTTKSDEGDKDGWGGMSE